MVDNDLSELDIRDKDQTVALKRSLGMVQAPMVTQAAPALAAPAASGGGAAAPAKDDGLLTVESPMVGTFYSKPNPESDNFVKVGGAVGPDTVVCLIEAMKVFNEVQAGVSGTIERVLVENGDPVEFGQKLFLVRPN